MVFGGWGWIALPQRREAPRVSRPLLLFLFLFGASFAGELRLPRAVPSFRSIFLDVETVLGFVHETAPGGRLDFAVSRRLGGSSGSRSSSHGNSVFESSLGLEFFPQKHKTLSQLPRPAGPDQSHDDGQKTKQGRRDGKDGSHHVEDTPSHKGRTDAGTEILGIPHQDANAPKQIVELLRRTTRQQIPTTHKETSYPTHHIECVLHQTITRIAISFPTLFQTAHTCVSINDTRLSNVTRRTSFLRLATRFGVRPGFCAPLRFPFPTGRN